jgi:hypothetical protein
MVLAVAYDTNLFANAITVIQESVVQILNVYIMGNPIGPAVNAISSTITNFAGSLAITIVAALIISIIFSILQGISEARLANTGSLKEALNIFEAAKDIKRIGVGKTLLLIIAVAVIIAIIEIILTTALSHYPFLLIISYIILTPYLGLVVQRAIGLLYSDIA